MGFNCLIHDFAVLLSVGVLSIAAARGESLPADTPLFPSVTRGFIKVLDRDLAAASIDKQDDRGRTVDVHALRHTYGSLLSAGGVAPRTAQAAMRHSSIDLTMNVYTDPRVLDVAGALDSLPALPLDGYRRDRQPTIATGTDDHRTAIASQLAPQLALTSDKQSKSGAIADNWAKEAVYKEERFRTAKNAKAREKQRVAEGSRTPDLRNHNPTL